MTHPASTKASSGIRGLDEVLRGGFERESVVLVQGSPGAGKTTLGLQFLLEGIRHRERCLYVTLAETKDEIEKIAASHGWSLEGLDVFELSGRLERSLSASSQTLYRPAEVELGETLAPLLEHVKQSRPHRVPFDSLSEVRLLAGDELRYRRELLALKEFFTELHSTVLLLEEQVADGSVTRTIVHGVVLMETIAPEYGAPRRRVSVTKLRGVAYAEGRHDYRVRTGGLEVYPRLVAAEHRRADVDETVSTGLSQLDTMLGGGLQRGTSLLLIGTTGTGKSAIATRVALSAVERGERAVVLLLEEQTAVFRARARALGMPVEGCEERGALALHSIDPAERTAGEIAGIVQRETEVGRASVVVVDGLSGYLNVMPGEQHLMLHMHELLSFLSHLGVVSVLTLAQHGLLGTALNGGVDISYLADSVVLVRHFEARGEIRKVISVVKKRIGSHESTLRELRFGPGGLDIGDPLHEFRGVLGGAPTFEGPPAHPLAAGRPPEAHADE